LSANVHVWHIKLNRPIQEVEELRTVLSHDEREKCSRLRAPGLERRFIVCRATLRMILGRRLHIRPDRLEFRYSSAGKPELLDVDAHRLHFNVTHSSEVAMVALSEGKPVGIDVEHIRPDFATTAIAERFFSIAEREQLRSMPEQVRPNAFFRCWTRKEAFIKAVGTGMAFPLDAFDVSLDEQVTSALLSIHGDHELAKNWTVCNLTAPPGFLASLAIARPNEIVSAGAPLD
jgi:4'-phosphopantetheinyl transferase